MADMEDSVLNTIIHDLDKVLLENPSEESSDEAPAGSQLMKGTGAGGLGVPGDAVGGLDPGIPSVGSVGHYQGACRPCAHNWKPNGCSKGRSCTFCHTCGEKDFQRKRQININKRRARRFLAQHAHQGSEGAAQLGNEQRSDRNKDGESEDSEGLTLMSKNVPVEYPKNATVPLSPVADVCGRVIPHGGHADDSGLLIQFEKADGKVQTMGSFDEQETATPSSSEDGPELRTPPRGPTPAPASPGRQTSSHCSVDNLPEYKLRTSGLWMEPARVEVGEATGLKTGTPSPSLPNLEDGEESNGRLAADHPAQTDNSLEPAWVPVPVEMLLSWPGAAMDAASTGSLGGLGHVVPPGGPSQEVFVQSGGFRNGLADPTNRTPMGPEASHGGLGATARYADYDFSNVFEGSAKVSVGSRYHAKGICRPCAHIWKPAGCSKGDACEFCHICGAKDFMRRRKANALRRQAKRVLVHGARQRYGDDAYVISL
mmetsp:Transcript_34428/g.106911  ORF Transcript_34428/g.106911 Transcript_34428/m.106911 type:complete len:485 (-) Transcript_34428:320-1774(-)